MADQDMPDRGGGEPGRRGRTRAGSQGVWSWFWQGVLGEFLNPHFVLTIAIVAIWGAAIFPALRVINKSLDSAADAAALPFQKQQAAAEVDAAGAGRAGSQAAGCVLSAEDQLELRKQWLESSHEATERVITLSKEGVASISAVFTTLLGLVLGHYFGQRGEQARAQRAESEAVLAKASAVDIGGRAKEDIQALLKVAEARGSESEQLRTAAAAIISQMSPEELMELPEETRSLLIRIGVVESASTEAGEVPADGGGPVEETAEESDE